MKVPESISSKWKSLWTVGFQALAISHSPIPRASLHVNITLPLPLKVWVFKIRMMQSFFFFEFDNACVCMCGYRKHCQDDLVSSSVSIPYSHFCFTRNIFYVMFYCINTAPPAFWVLLSLTGLTLKTSNFALLAKQYFLVIIIPTPPGIIIIIKKQEYL